MKHGPSKASSRLLYIFPLLMQVASRSIPGYLFTENTEVELISTSGDGWGSTRSTLHSSCKSELSWVFQTNDTLGYCHMSMIEALDDSTLVVSFQAAKSHEGYNDQAIYMATSSDLGASWSDTQLLVSGGDYAVWGPVWHWDKSSGTLWLFYSQSGSFDPRGPDRSSVGGDILAITSRDRGASWSAPRSILPFENQGVRVPKVTANKPVVLGASGAWLLPFWQTPSSYLLDEDTPLQTSAGAAAGGNFTGRQAAGVLMSTDGGATWQPHMVPQADTKVIENTVAELADGSVLQLFRTATGHLYEARSHDGGSTWTTPLPSNIPNPNSKTFMFTDAENHQILAYNPTTKGRNPLALAVSYDGASFKEYCDVDPGMRTKSLEYPTAVQVADRVYTVFSADHYTGIKLSITTVPEKAAESNDVVGKSKDDPKQRAALIDFAQATQYKQWKHSDHWLGSKSYCEWYGVKCSGSDVVELSLGSNKLSGSLPGSIAALQRLQVLDLDGGRPADYTGCGATDLHRSPLPEALWSLTELTKLNLEYTCVAGPISPKIGNLKKLKYAQLHGNFLNGSIPLEMNELQDLEEFKLGRNPLTGTFPAMTKLHKLKKFNCNFCALTGPIPDIFDSFPDLEQSFWDGNGLTGTLPASLGGLKKLGRISFNINALSGVVPEALCEIASLTDCRIGADTNLTAYEANYPWIVKTKGNRYTCPLPTCATGNGVCNKYTDCHPVVNPCSPVECKDPKPAEVGPIHDDRAWSASH